MTSRHRTAAEWAAWGRQRHARRGWLARTRCYPRLVALWAENAWRTRWGYPLLPVPSVALIKAPKRVREQVVVQRGNVQETQGAGAGGGSRTG